jgi:hypothetical protein
MFEYLHSEESRPRDAEPGSSGDARGESGQVTIIVVFGALAFVLLIAFVFNSAKQTSRKIEMQGAADSAAVASGVWMARGMNLTALNNNSMVEMLSIMITVRSILQTEQILHNALFVLQFVPYIGADAAAELAIVEVEMPFWEAIDHGLNDSGRFGWDVLTSIDTLNKVIKKAFPVLATAQALNYAKLNGADYTGPGFPLPGWVFPGKPNNYGVALYPLARGPRTLLVEKAQECALKHFSVLRLMAAAAVIRGPITLFLGLLFLDVRIDRNIDSLLGKFHPLDTVIAGFGDIEQHIIEDIFGINLGVFGDVLGGLGNILTPSVPLINPRLTPSLRWEADVRPMILSETPETDETNNTRPSLVKVHEFLQFLAVALGKSEAGSPIGGEKFPNPDFLPRITYAQSDVYNPTHWDMFTQDWRAKLTRARLLDVKCQELGQKAGIRSLCGQGWSLVNTH